MHIGFIYTNFNVTVSQPRPGVGQVKHELNGTRNDDMSIDVGKDINDIKDTVTFALAKRKASELSC